LLSHIIKEKGTEENGYIGRKLPFDTYYFDDMVKLDVYHKNNPSKVNCIAKGSIDLREISFAPYPYATLIGIPIRSKKLGKDLGYVYFRVSY
jgi:hypothetical protein